MSNKIFHSSIMAVAAGLIITMSVSCGKTPVDGGDEADGTGVIDIRTSIDALTKAPVLDEEGKGNFSRGDIFTVTVSGSGFASTGRNYVEGITELMWKDLDLPEDVGDVYFSGCYPVQETAVDGIFTFTVSPTEETDLLLARAVNVKKDANTAVNLAFRHALHRLVIIYVSDDLSDEQLSQVSTSVRALSSCSVDQTKGIILDGTAAGLSEVGSRQGRRASFFIVPQEKDYITLDVSVGTMTRTIDIPDHAQGGSPVAMLEGGKSLTVQINVSSDEIKLDGVQIGGWEHQGTVDGEIEL